MPDKRQETQGSSTQRYWSVWHVAAVVVGFIVAIVVFRYTGDSDVVLALGSGTGIGLIGWFLAYLHLRQPRDL